MAPFLSFLCSFPARNPEPVALPWLRVQGLLASRAALSWLLQRCLPQLPSALQLHWSPQRQHCWDLHNANTSISLLRCQGVHRCIDLETTDAFISVVQHVSYLTARLRYSFAQTGSVQHRRHWRLHQALRQP